MISTLEKYYDEGLLYKQIHPDLPLWIWNYSEKCQFDSLWDEVTLKCRGLVTDKYGNTVAQGFKKFFNYEEVIHKDEIPWNSEYVHIQNKEDGSLGILFNYSNEWIMATRGSFTSDQAIKGMEILKKKYDLSKFPVDVIFLMEIIYPENRIVLDYGKEEKVVFLSAVMGEEELSWEHANKIFNYIGILPEDIVSSEIHKTFSQTLFDVLQDGNEQNKEGYVIRFHPSNYRIKIKFDDYVRLHRIMTNVSTISVWEVLNNNQDIKTVLKDVPDEFYKKIKEYVNDLISQYSSIKDEYERAYKNIINLAGSDNRAVFAEHAKQYKYPGILFKMMDNRNYDSLIWKSIRPEYRKL